MNILRSLVLPVACWALSLASVAQVPEGAVWIDVRTPAEYESGHLSQARLIPWDSIDKGIASLQLAADTPIYLYCASGGRSARAQQRLQQLGYTRVVNAGGLADARKLLEQTD